MFEAYGTVDRVSVVTDRETGRARGFGFVEMSSDDEAERAIAALNGRELDGRALNINEARPKEDRGGGGGGGYRGGGGGGGQRQNRRWSGQPGNNTSTRSLTLAALKAHRRRDRESVVVGDRNGGRQSHLPPPNFYVCRACSTARG